MDIRISVDAPAGFEAMPPESLHLDLDPRFATGEGSARVEDGVLHLDFKCRQVTGKFPAADYAAYRRIMAQALSFIEREVVFKAVGH